MAPKQRKFVAYYRVSTAQQGRSGLGLEAQKETVQRMVESRGGRLIYSYTEVESGKRSDNRPELAHAIKRCRASNAEIVVAKLDRLSRNAAFLHTLHDSGVKIIASDLPSEEADPLLLGVMAGLAQKEREMISARTKAAMAAARARGKKFGGLRAKAPNIALYQEEGTAALMKKADDYADGMAEAVVEARASGATSLRQIAAHLNAAGFVTSRGCEWAPSGVARLLRYLA